MRLTSSGCLWQNPTASTVIAERLAVDEKMTGIGTPSNVSFRRENDEHLVCK